MNIKNTTKKTLATLVGAAIVASSVSAHAAKATKKVEKCYGIAKAGKNQCGNSKHACAGQAKKNSSGNEWMYVLKGSCEMIVGSSLEPKS